MVLQICDRFHCTPSAARAEGASVLRLLALERRAWPERFESEAVY